MKYIHPEYLISPQELFEIIEQNNVKVFDTSVLLHLKAGEHTAESGKNDFLEEHIKGAGFIDLISDWSDTSSNLKNTLPSATELNKAIGASGISENDQVVLYSSGHMMWATRAWWCLYYAGHSNIKILNGNIRAWKDAGLPCEAGENSFAKTQFNAVPRPEIFASTLQVEKGISERVCTVNALTTALYEGTGDSYFGRRGHIPGSLSLPFTDILENEFFLEADALSETLEQRGMISADNVIIYCGGGIAATLNAFACKLLGQNNVSVYDGSMSEWALSKDRELNVGANP
jgi:thiosulfate/3-mercaptopyruvate sulfurtransferase